MEIAMSIAANFVDFLIERVESLATLASAPTASTPDRLVTNARSCASDSMAGTDTSAAIWTSRSSVVTRRSGVVLTWTTLQLVTFEGPIQRSYANNGSSFAANRCANEGALASFGLSIGSPVTGHVTLISPSNGWISNSSGALNGEDNRYAS